MFDPKTSAPKPDRRLLAGPPAQDGQEPRQQRLMLGALVLLLAALGSLLYRDRDFWFPEAREAQDQPLQQTAPAPAIQTPAEPSPVIAQQAPAKRGRSHSSGPQPKEPGPTAPSAPAAAAITERTLLPPLEVEVVAGDTRQTVRPGTNSLRVDLQPGSAPQAVPEASAALGAAETTARVTSNAAEHVQMSSDTAQVVSHSVKPGYPVLARQMKVQGSVILQALISRDGRIQDLRVVSGPPILANAAQEAVKQWHFKPQYQGTETVETQARITVNFTISTN